MGHISSECTKPAPAKKHGRDDANFVTEFINCEDDEPDVDEEEGEYEDAEAGYLVDEECETALIAVDDKSIYRGCLVVDTGSRALHAIVGYPIRRPSRD